MEMAGWSPQSGSSIHDRPVGDTAVATRVLFFVRVSGGYEERLKELCHDLRLHDARTIMDLKRRGHLRDRYIEVFDALDVVRIVQFLVVLSRSLQLTVAGRRWITAARRSGQIGRKVARSSSVR